MKKQPKLRPIIFYALILCILLFCMVELFSTKDSVELKYSEVLSLFQNEQVKSFTTRDNVLHMELKSAYQGKTELDYALPDFSVFYSDMNELVEQQYADGVLESYDYQPDTATPWWVMYLPSLVLALIVIVALIFISNRANGGGGNVMKFSKANVRVGKSDRTVTFDDVAGAEEEKAELQEIVEFLRDPDKYTRLGAKVPRGVLLVGPPGTGKTLIAKAVAGEAQVQFLSISGSDFVELYVGVGAGRVRDLFDQAKKMAPAIIFIDEIDAVGRRRGAGLGGGHDEREQTLNQLLVEMDGFTRNDGVIVMAATNRKDILDPALLRPGRFDRQIYIGAPDCSGREAILKVHAKNKPLADTVNLNTVARATVGFTGAELENLLNEAALLAARANRPCITMPDLEEAMLKVWAGPQKKSRKVSEHTRRLTAYHEAGHAVAAYYLPTHDPVQQVTIIPRGQTGGLTLYLPDEDEHGNSRNEMYERIVSALGGRVAEQLRMEDISTGASADIKQATAIAHEMVTKYGMSEKMGTVCYDNDDSEVFVGMSYAKTKPYSDRTAGDIDDEVKALIDRAYNQCVQILQEHGDKLETVAQYLMAHDTMSRNQFEACMRGEEIPENEHESIFDRFTRQDSSGTGAMPGQDVPQNDRPGSSPAADVPQNDQSAQPSAQGTDIPQHPAGDDTGDRP